MAITRPFYSIVRVYGRSLLERLTKCFMFPSAFYARIGDRANEPSCALNETTYAHPFDKKEVLSINRNTVAVPVPSDNCAQ